MKQRHGHRLAEDSYIDFSLAHVVIPYLGSYNFTSLMRGTQQGFTCLLGARWLWLSGLCFCLWLTDCNSVGTSVYIISQRLHIPVVSPHDLLHAVNPHELLTPRHHLFSSNHFVYAAGTFCSRNFWLTDLSKVNMQQKLWIQTCKALSKNWPSVRSCS